MPIAEISMVQGRDPRQLRHLISKVTDAIAQSLEAPPESIRVIVRELLSTHWAIGDVTIAERASG